MRRVKWLVAGLIAASFAPVAIAQAPPAGSIQVRMRNGTGQTMEQVRISYPIVAQAEQLAPGEAIPYQAGRWMMGAMSLEAVIGGAHYVMRPVDHLGPRYRPGRYTYVVSFVPVVVPGEPRRLMTRVVEDR